MTKSLSQVAWIPETSTATIILRCVGSMPSSALMDEFFRKAYLKPGIGVSVRNYAARVNLSARDSDDTRPEVEVRGKLMWRGA